ncbi:hypothetical protein KIH79_10950 [Bifidobacterium sp. 82T10]|uniref:Wzy n=1 Tax=Bifidobacterium miconis TaxID=2834435 RepID=A0ABS6WH99_9BIFI|nr:hypothetical protein [Bifidobacterium miconis]MBW3093428.1 hypothetical protein [Bifidobacterium miconis]
MNLKKQSNVSVVLDYILVISLLLASNSIYALKNDDLWLYCLILLVVSLIHLIWNTICIGKKILQYLCIGLFIFFPSFLVQLLLEAIHHDGSFYSYTWIQYVLILPILVVDLLLSGLSIIEKFVNTVFVISVISLFFWVLSSFFKLSPTSSFQIEWSTGGNVDSYYGLYFNSQPIYFGSQKIWRNSSIFSEPLILCAIVAMALYFMLFIIKRYNYIYLFVFVLTVFSSTSTSGILYLILIAFPFMLNYFINHKSKLIRTIFLVVVPIIILAFLLVMYNVASAKIASTVSGQTHRNDILYGINAWLDSPFAGYGLKSDDFIWNNYLSLFREGVGYTSGFIFFAIHGGILLSMLVLFPSFLVLLFNNKWEYKYFAFFVLFIFFFAVVQNLSCFVLCIALCYVFSNYEHNTERN